MSEQGGAQRSATQGQGLDPGDAFTAFSRLYRGRTDRLGLRREHGYEPVTGGLTPERFREHLDQRETYALYLMDDLGRVSFGLFDLDVLPRKQPWPALLERFPEEREKVRRLIAALGGLGIAPEHLLVEFPTVGYHVLLFFEEPIEAALVKAFMEAALLRAGLEGTPFYPRRTAAGTPGDLVQLPFRLNLNTGRRSNLVRDLTTFDPEAYSPEPDFLPLRTVRRVPRPLLLRALGRPEAEPAAGPR